MQIEMIKVEELIPYAGNPRKNDKAVKAVAESIKNFGFKVPITIDKQGVIVTGHTRLRAAVKLGMTEVPVIRLNDLSDEQVRAFRLVDNKVAEISEWDIELLMKELGEIQMDLTSFGFEKSKTSKDLVEDEYNLDPPKTPKSKLGDLYKLGAHRLICGDSTDKAVIEKLMEFEVADCLITDPPYNIDYDGGANAKRNKIMNDHLSDGEFGDFLTKAFQAAAFGMKPGAGFYIWHADKETINFRQACENADLEVKQTIIWNKNTFTLGRQDYQWKHEPCLYGWKRGGSHYFTDDRTFSTMITEEPIDIDKLKANEARELLKRILGPETATSIIDVDKPLKSEQHPTMKPIKLIGKQMINSTKPGQNVLDIFGGSGTTLIVAEQLERKCYMVELDPKYVDVIIERWELYTGLSAEKIE